MTFSSHTIAALFLLKKYKLLNYIKYKSELLDAIIGILIDFEFIFCSFLRGHCFNQIYVVAITFCVLFMYLLHLEMCYYLTPTSQCIFTISRNETRQRWHKNTKQLLIET